MSSQKFVILRKRHRIISLIRRFFDDRDYLEVETPIRIPAPAPETHIEAVPADGWYLHTSPELCMKRLVAKGYERIYQICRCFRKDERGERHLPEITLLEWYTARRDYRFKMDQIEELIRFVARGLFSSERFAYQNDPVDLASPWRRMSVRDAFARFTDTTAEKALSTGKFDEYMAFDIEPNLGTERPVFLYDYPADCGALARLHPENDNIAERFELYIAGMELCNAFSELTDADEQRQRFEIEITNRKKMGKPVTPMPEKFLADLEYMPDATGCALGVDRLVMLLTDTLKIDDVAAFTPEDL